MSQRSRIVLPGFSDKHRLLPGLKFRHRSQSVMAFQWHVRLQTSMQPQQLFFDAQYNLQSMSSMNGCNTVRCFNISMLIFLQLVPFSTLGNSSGKAKINIDAISSCNE